MNRGLRPPEKFFFASFENAKRFQNSHPSSSGSRRERFRRSRPVELSSYKNLLIRVECEKNMQTATNNLKSRTDDAVWQYLARYSLSEFLIEVDHGDELTVGSLLQTIRDLGIPPECLKKIECTLTGFVNEKKVRVNHEKVELPGFIRLFCPKKTIDDLNSAKPSIHFNEEQSLEPTQIIHQFEPKLNGGWGYFLIERGESFPAGSSVRSHHLLDLYLYKEGK